MDDRSFILISICKSSVGDLRFALPQAIMTYNKSINATSYGASCPQQSAPFPVSLQDIFNTTIPSIIKPLVSNNTNATNSTPESEDCKIKYTIGTY